MSFEAPWMLAVALLAAAASLAGYLALDRRRTATLAAAGLPGPAAHRARHLPYLLLWTGIVLLLAALARPYAAVPVPRLASTVVLAIDVSSSMTATDADPSRLGQAQDVAAGLIDAQPAGVDIGVLAFGQGALPVQTPTGDHEEALAAVNRLSPGGGTSIGEAILASLTMITGRPVAEPADGAEPPDLGYWGSATIVVISDGEETGGADPLLAADLAAGAGVRIVGIGVGSPQGTVIEVDGFRVATRLEEDGLAALAESTGGSYSRAGEDGGGQTVLNALQGRLTVSDEPLELTAGLAGIAVMVLTAGGLVMVARTGRVL